MGRFYVTCAAGVVVGFVANFLMDAVIGLDGPARYLFAIVASLVFIGLVQIISGRNKGRPVDS